MRNKSKFFLMCIIMGFSLFSIINLLINETNGDRNLINSNVQFSKLLETYQKFLYNDISNPSVFIQLSDNSLKNSNTNKSIENTWFDLCYNSVTNIYNTSKCDIIPPPPPLNFTIGK